MQWPCGVRAIAIAIAALPATALAQGAAVDVDFHIDIDPPGVVAPPPPPPAPAPRELEVALHVGVLHATQSYDIGTGFDQPGPHGTSMLADVAVGGHVRPWFSLAGYGAVSSIASRAGYYQNMDVRDQLIDLGVEARLCGDGVFAGALGGIEPLRSSFSGASHWATGLQAGLEVGYTGRAHDGVAPEVLVAATYTTFGTTAGLYWEGPAGASIVAARASVGVRF